MVLLLHESTSVLSVKCECLGWFQKSVPHCMISDSKHIPLRSPELRTSNQNRLPIIENATRRGGKEEIMEETGWGGIWKTYSTVQSSHGLSPSICLSMSTALKFSLKSRCTSSLKGLLFTVDFLAPLFQSGLSKFGCSTKSHEQFCGMVLMP